MRKTFLLLALPLIIINGCTKTQGLTGPEGPAGQLLKGNLFGFVDLFDATGNLQSPEGVKVNIEGTTDTVLTNTYGSFELDSIKTGTYTLDFKKQGYGSVKINSLQLVGGGNTYLPNRMQMSQIPQYYATSVSATSGTNNLILTGNLNVADQQPKSVLAFAGPNSSVSSTPGNYYNVFSGVSGQSGNYTITIDWGMLHSSGFPRNSTVYIAVYGSANVINSSSYMDSYTGSTVYNAISTQSPATTSVVVDR